MPFTFSHPAAVLPLLRDGRGRGPLVASALVAGSLAPDVPFFVESLRPGSYAFGDVTHRHWAVPTVDVAIAAGLVAGWHWLLRDPLVALLPHPWADRVEVLTARRGKRAPGDVAWFVASAALGAFTHVGWDSFTHHDRCAVRVMPTLRREVAGMPVYHALQWGTSAVGLGVLAASGARVLSRRHVAGPRRAALTPAARSRGAVLLAAGAVLGAAHRAARDLPCRPGRRTPAEVVATFSFGAGAGAAVGATAYAAAARLASRRSIRS